MQVLDTNETNRAGSGNAHRMLAFMDRSPVEQALVNLGNAKRMTDLMQQSTEVRELHNSIVQCMKLACVDIPAAMRAVDETFDDTELMERGDSPYVPHPMIVLRAELRNANMYLRTIC